MKMTEAQAAAYCGSQAQASLNEGPRGEEASREWNRMRNEIEQDGLEAVERRLIAWLKQVRADQDSRHTANTNVADAFLTAIYDEEEVKRAIAGELKERVKQEIEEKSTFPLRVIYLQHLRNHLGNVQDDATDLEDYEEAKEAIIEQLERIETEYGQWITDAIAAQED